MSEARDRLQTNDIRFVEVVGGLTDREWSASSLCDGWSNHEVLAHLAVGYHAAPTTIVSGMARRRGSFDLANADLARTLAAKRSPAELIADLSSLLRHPRGIGRVFPPRLLLGDHVIHELDIVLPLGLAATIPISTLVAVLDTQVAVPNPFVPARARARGLRLETVDADWTRGRGPIVTGSAAALASALAGRGWAADRLDGDGVSTLLNRL